MPRGGVLLCLAASLAPALAPAVARAASFVIEDALSDEQVAEETHVFIDGHAVGSFRLTTDHPAATLEVRVPDAEPHDYVLCGETRVRLPGGGEETVPINDSGTLSDADGRVYIAFTRGYASFFLVDATAGRPEAELRTHLGPACPAPVSDGAHTRIG